LREVRVAELTSSCSDSMSSSLSCSRFYFSG
uniref:Uncharacterized protein n=1 Tax=Heligmosomoides polygyrus TaxID=6339 RepID=A0A183G434_HELPZ